MSNRPDHALTWADYLFVFIVGVIIILTFSHPIGQPKTGQVESGDQLEWFLARGYDCHRDANQYTCQK